MENQAKGCELIISGKLRGQRAKAMKFRDGYMIKSGQPTKDYVDTATRHVLLRQGILLLLSFSFVSRLFGLVFGDLSIYLFIDLSILSIYLSFLLFECLFLHSCSCDHALNIRCFGYQGRHHVAMGSLWQSWTQAIATRCC